MRIELTARNSGYYIVRTDAGEYSRHTTEREAVENCTEAIDEGHTGVHYVHDYVVDAIPVEAPAPEPDPEPEPEPDPPPPEPDPVTSPDFLSLWRGADWRDGGTWVPTGGMNHDTYLQVFDASLDPDVPSGRGLRTIGNSSDDFWNVAQPAAPPRIPEVGETIRWRWYYKLIMGDGDGNYHPHDWGNGYLSADPRFCVITYALGPSSWQPLIRFPGTNPYGARESGFRFQNGVWYHQEVSFERIGENTFRPDWQVWGPDGVLLFTGADLYDNWGSGQSTIRDVTFNGSPADSTLFEGFSPGVGGLSGTPHEAERYAAVACVVGGAGPVGPFDPERGW